MYIEHFLELIIPSITAILELIGILIIIFSSSKAIIDLIKNRLDFSKDEIKIKLAKALAFSLEFKLAAEIIKTVIVHSIEEFLVLSSVVILRVILTFVIEWEIKSAKSNS